jgi:hypothetical protein
MQELSERNHSAVSKRQTTARVLSSHFTLMLVTNLADHEGERPL